MGIGKKITKGMIGGGVDISHLSKMSQTAANQMSFPGGMPGKQDSNGVVGKGMAEYLSGKAVGMNKYKPNGVAKINAMYNGEPGVQQEDFKQYSAKQMGEIEEPSMSGGAAKAPSTDKERKAVTSVNKIDDKKDNYNYQKPDAKTLKEVKKPREASKEIGKSKIEAGKKLKKEGRQEKRAARKNARKSKRSARLDKKIALQEFKGKQKLKSGDKLGAKAKQDRIKNLKDRKAKK